MSDIPPPLPTPLPPETAVPQTTPPVSRLRIGERLAWLASLATHATALLVLATTTWLVAPPVTPLLLSSVEEPEPLKEEAFRVSEELTLDLGALSDGGQGDAAAAAPVEAATSQVALNLTPMIDFGQVPSLEDTTPVLMSPDPNTQNLIQGVGAVGATGSRGAVDRLTGEILNSLDQSPTVVVWLFDRSASLRSQRDEMVARFDQVYEELGVIGARHAETLADDGEPALLTTIAAFGETNSFLTPQPTADLAQIKAAVSAIEEDQSGAERVFAAVEACAERHKRYRLKEPRRNVVVIVVTDESGDDFDRLDTAVQKCRKLRMPVYAIGAPAPFGRDQSYVRYVDPDPQYDQSVQWLPVRQGPESLRAERLKLGIIGGRDFSGPMLDSGFGPFGLTRLCAETGGFFIAVHPLRVDSGRARRGPTGDLVARLDYFFDERLMRRYRPDYVPLAEYDRRVRENRARAALVQSAAMSWAAPLGDVRREFPAVDEAEFVSALAEAQQAAAIVEPQLQTLVTALRRGERDRDRERSPRWQAGYDLAMGAALAAAVRAEAYNAALATARGGLMPTRSPSDTWIIDPSKGELSDSRLAAAAADARRYLTRVVEEHPGTPWALLAEREQQQPLGWAWRDDYRDVVNQRERAQQRAQRPNNRPPPPAKPRRSPKL
ncbi:vWA domain-containing protein [Botrimarina hoheduenensis]|uniref:VWFA domain-containing protein n=1 Tax=Botrimarina hoheduenensis TaxID=2528000 RepID=A0A5C5VUJ1_9BACT|nr:vWA domain-containing protein [Botrimarina hoheduenensis]TWT41585.1 hypothetical protein Pla111_29620 [Botrimarina hoheduenensis]